MSIRVLIVEDNDDYRELLELFLRHKGFEVISAVNGYEAVIFSNTENPHVILMDLNLPVLNGWEATRMISQNPPTKGIPIIVVSANCSDELGKEALSAGAVGCVQKPVDIEMLPDLILSYAVNEKS